MSETYVKRYDVGNIRLDAPYAHFIYELPLLSFGDIQHTIGLSLVFNSRLAGTNPFYIANGYKLNLQKRLILESVVPTGYEDGSGNLCTLINASDGKYTFDDDSQRILRTAGNTFELEYPDYSKEMYDNLGRIYSVYDKYGDEPYLTYSYNMNGKLSSVSYRGNKQISITYSANGGLIESISYLYNNTTICTSNFTYPESNNVKIAHYSGVNYHMSFYDNEYVAYSTDSDDPTDSYSSLYSQRITCYMPYSDYFEISRDIGDKTIEETRYTVRLIPESDKFELLSISKDGVTHQVQYENGKPCYFYEEPRFPVFEKILDTSPYTSDVNVYNNGEIVGYQSFEDGERLLQEDTNQISNRWKIDTNFPVAINCDFILSGWFLHTNDITQFIIRVIEDPLLPPTDFVVSSTSYDMWKFFSVKCHVSNISSLQVEFRIPTERGYSFAAYDKIKSLDLKIALQPNEQNPEINGEHLTTVEDVLIDESQNLYLPLSLGFSFYNGETELEKSDYNITANDILKYKINQKYGSHKNEIYYNNCKGIISNAGEFRVGVGDTKINIETLAIGKRVYAKGNQFVTRTNFYAADEDSECLATKTSANGDYYKQLFYDSNLDLVQSIDNNVYTYLERNSKGLITEKTVSAKTENGFISLSTIKNNYNIDSSKLESSTNEFDKTTTFITNDIWGVIENALDSDGRSITDVYDGDFNVRLQRKFAKGDAEISNNFAYSNGNLSLISSGNLNYGFSYDGDMISEIRKNNSAIETTIYDEFDEEIYDWGYKKDSTYYPDSAAPLYSTEQIIGDYERIVEIKDLLSLQWDVSPSYTNENYSLSGFNSSSSKIAQITDNITGNKTKFAYEKGNLVRSTVFNTSNDIICEQTMTRDSIGRITSEENTIDDRNIVDARTYVTSCTSPEPDSLVGEYNFIINNSPAVSVANTYDAFKRLTQKSTTIGGETFTKHYGYDNTRLNTVCHRYGNVNKHTYNLLYNIQGQITDLSDNSDEGYANRYEYDSFGRLCRENNQLYGKTILYNYDAIGNITLAQTYAYTNDAINGTPTSEDVYTYNNILPDRLVSFNGKNITYDNLHRVKSYDGWVYTWSRDKLSYMRKGLPRTENQEYVFTYDAYGRRLTKSYRFMPGLVAPIDYITSRTSTYKYDMNGRLITEVNTLKYNDGTTTVRNYDYLYDESEIVGLIYTVGNSTETYYYDKNPLGDVVGILDSSSNTVVKYQYDAYGNCTYSGSVNTDLAQNNPIRYRSYYYDFDTGLYYLNARYYNPEWRRFISPDSTEFIDSESINGLNLYAYCHNDPVNYADPSGHFPFFLLTVLLAVGITAAVDLIPDQKLNLHWGWYVGAAVIGAAIGLGISYYATGSAFSSVGKVFSGVFGKTTYYRTMTADDYATLQSTGQLPAGSETFITPSSSYASTYNGVTVKFTVRNRTVNWLTKIGVKDGSTLVGSMYPSMPTVPKGWMATNAYFKAEQGIINIGLGYGRALDIFNKGILMFGLL